MGINNQNDIFYFNGDNVQAMKKNPQLEGFKKRGVEVLLFSDHVGNFWVNSVRKYKNRELKSITSDKIDLDKIKKIEDGKEADKEKTKRTEQYKDLISEIKGVLKDKIKDVVLSSKLVNSPAC